MAQEAHFGGIAGGYALAVFELALETNAVEAVSRDFTALRGMIDESADLARFVRAPVFNRDEPQKGMNAILVRMGAEKMTKRGYAPARLETLLREIDVLATLDTAQGIAEDDDSSVGADTEDRDRTYLELKEFMKELKGVCRALFRKQPETLALLKL